MSNVVKCLIVTLLTPMAVAEGNSLSQIASRGEFRIGHREASIPFSYIDDRGQASGYSVDLCLRVLDAIRAELKRPDIKARFVALKPAERISALKENKVDVECSTTTNTVDRQKEIAFSYTIFMAGVRLLVKSDLLATDFADLRNKTVVVNQKTTTEKVLQTVNAQRSLLFNVLPSPDTSASFKSLVEGTAHAMASDDAVLVGLVAKTGRPDAFKFVGKYLSVEPYAIGMRRDDAQLAKTVDATLARLYASGEIYKIYDKWFNTLNIRLPMNQYMKENVRLPNKFGKVD
jgi:glutamate/aspartate transport system substrate-binding protein